MFNDWLRRRGSNSNPNQGNSSGGYKENENEEDVEFYEDTHNERGEYIGRQAQQQNVAATQYDRPSRAQDTYSVNPNEAFSAAKMPTKGQTVIPRSYQNVVVYEPRTPEDVQILIDYLKRREPAIINLDNVEADVAQRVLDFVSGAIYALDGSVHRIAGNIFLLSPEGVEITVPYEL